MKTQSRKEIIVDNLINIKKYGFSEVFSSEIPEDDPLEPARVLSQEKGFYRVVTDNGEKLAEVSGKIPISNYSSLRISCRWRLCIGKLERIRQQCNH